MRDSAADMVAVQALSKNETEKEVASSDHPKRVRVVVKYQVSRLNQLNINNEMRGVIIP